MCQQYRLKTTIFLFLFIQASNLFSANDQRNHLHEQIATNKSGHQLPSIMIRTGSPHIKKKKAIFGQLKLFDPTQHDTQKWQLIDIKRRGNSSDSFAKKQYSIKFYDQSFDKKKVTLLDHAKDSQEKEIEEKNFKFWWGTPGFPTTIFKS